MKQLFRVLFVILGLTAPGSYVLASHYRGGEITWTCQGNGMFVFNAKFYRDCNGIPGPGGITLSTTVPVMPTILLNLVQQNDISPTGFSANGVTNCADCSMGGGTNIIPGLVEEYVYQSMPVQLNGVPPVNGWHFRWGECCRSDLTNISFATGLGFGLSATMFPVNGQNTSICFDSSPFFVESPTTMYCTGYPVTYNQLAIDPDRDSLVFSWGVPFSEVYTQLPFAPGYSVNSPLPGPVQNPLNSGVVLDTKTGAVSFTSYTGGQFMTKIVVTAYKNGVKTAEVYREFALTLNNNCPPILGLSANYPPLISAPFINPVTGLQTEYSDTVYAGETVNFLQQFTDFQFFLNGGPQLITISAAGDIFGNNFTDPLSGCTQPPCATYSVPLPTIVPIAGMLQFNWETTADHLNANNRYFFTVTARDNYCPANAVTTNTISIILRGNIPLLPPVLRCAAVNNDGSVTLNWTPTPSNDSLNVFLSYKIYAATSPSGTYQLVDSVTTGINATSYTHTAASLQNLFGTTANQQKIYYRVYIHTGGVPNGFTGFVNTLSTIKATVSIGPLSQALINWTEPSSFYLGSQDTWYKLYREYPVGTWTFLDSTTSTSYTDNFTNSFCDDSVSYRIELSDTTGCTSVSQVAKLLVNTPASMATILPANPVICQGSNLILTTSPGYSYLWSTGDTTQTININSPGVYTVTVSNGLGCSATNSTTVVVQPAPVPIITGITTICQGNSTTLNAGPGYASYLWNIGANTQTISVSSPGIYTATVTSSNGCTGSDSINIVVNPLPNPVAVANGPTSFCRGDSVLLNVPGMFNTYQWYHFNLPVMPLNLQPSHVAKSRGVYKCLVSDVNGCTNFSNGILVSVPCIPPRDEEEKSLTGDEIGDVVIYPNPSTGSFFIQFDHPVTGKEIIKIYDVAGREVRFKLTEITANLMLLEGLGHGIYLLSLEDCQGRATRLIRQVRSN